MVQYTISTRVDSDVMNVFWSYCSEVDFVKVPRNNKRRIRISAFSLQSTLSILGLTETWIGPEDSATPAALSKNFSLSHTQRQVGRGGGTGLLISNNWKYSTYSPLCNYNSFESHAITVIAPIKLQIVVIERPPGQIYSPLPREAGWVAVLFHGGWHSNLSFWRFQHSSRKALCYTFIHS